MKEIILLGFLVSAFLAVNTAYIAWRGGLLRRAEMERDNPHRK